MKQPVDHIVRPRLPWRDPSEPALTECGYEASKVQSLSREDFAARLADYGRQRTALLTCMTCMSTYERHPTWEQEPRLALSREVEWEVKWWNTHTAPRETNGHRLKDELIAIAALIAAHPDEFRALLDDRRARHEWLARKEDRK